MSKAIKAVVLGASGYVGGELLRLIAGHPNFELVAAVSDSQAGEPVASTFAHLGQAFENTAFVARDRWFENIPSGSRVAYFSAAPHGAAAASIAAALKVAKAKEIALSVVDSSADFRYARQSDWESVYGATHGAPELLDQFSCAVPEHLPEAATPHVGHPGCFATATLLATVPLIRSGLTEAEVFVTGITGSTGSGKSPSSGTHHPERNSNLYAYKPLCHRHSPEIASLSTAASGRETTVHFVPHSGPFSRGIHVTVQAKTTATVNAADLRRVFSETYEYAPFVQVLETMPKLKNVVASNMCQLSVASDGTSVVVTAVIDNLVKGAAGGAVQWMNRLMNLPETAGLNAAAPGWT